MNIIRGGEEEEEEKKKKKKKREVGRKDFKQQRKFVIIFQNFIMRIENNFQVLFLFSSS